MHVYNASTFEKEQSEVIVTKGESGKYEPIHTHEFVEIVYILSGEAEHSVNDVTYNVSEGDLIFMNYGCTHKFVSKNGFSYINILFLPENVSKELITRDNILSFLLLTSFDDMRNDSSYGKLSFRRKEKIEIESLILSMHKEYRNKLNSWQTVLSNSLSTLLILMMRKNAIGVEKDDLIDTWHNLADYIEKNLNSDLSPSALAKKCFYNPSYFSRIFKERLGLSPSAYITDRRLERAVNLLRETNLTVDKIAEDVGFSDRKTLYLAFSRRYNITPAKYRAEIKSKKTV